MTILKLFATGEKLFLAQTYILRRFKMFSNIETHDIDFLTLLSTLKVPIERNIIRILLNSSKINVMNVEILNSVFKFIDSMINMEKKTFCLNDVVQNLDFIVPMIGKSSAQTSISSFVSKLRTYMKEHFDPVINAKLENKLEHIRELLNKNSSIDGKDKVLDTFF